jgi:hypothetical protein
MQQQGKTKEKLPKGMNQVANNILTLAVYSTPIFIDKLLQIV